jgi:hypothetical protein
MSEAGRDAAIVGVAEDKLLVTSRGIEASYALEDLGLQAKASIAGQVADGSSTKQAAVAAFFYLAAGQESLGRTWLASAGRHASVVRKSLNDR